MFKNKSLKLKLVFGFLMAGLLPVFFTSMISYFVSSDGIISEAKSKLLSIRESKAYQIEELFHNMQAQIGSLAENKVTKDALINFESAFDDYGGEVKLEDSVVHKSLSMFYKDEFGKKYSNLNNNEDSSFASLLNQLSPLQKKMQYTFISDNKNALGEKDKLVNINNGTKYSDAHNSYHKTFQTYLNKFGYYDIFLVSAKNNSVIYSVFKELDFATSLVDGPYKDSGLAQAYKGSLDTQPGEVYITEMAAYYPSYEAPAAFLSSPIYDDGKLLGALIFQIPVPKINHILTGNNSWKKMGQGDSGETYIIGKDFKMRSVSRFFSESKPEFLKLMKELGESDKNLSYMSAQETTALASTVKSHGAEAVIRGETGFSIFPDYRGVNVLSSYRPLKLKGLNWYLLSEMDEDEALYPIQKLQFYMIITGLISVILIFLYAFFTSNNLSNKINVISEKLNIGASQVLQSSSSISEQSNLLATSTEEQSASLQETSASITEISSMVDKNSESSSQVAKQANENEAIANQGKEVVHGVIRSIQSIHDNTEMFIQNINESNQEILKISDVINEISEKTKVINDIVFQTKLLSFNASVEAARAGENGKGFAVVAEEVGALAQMSGNAANEISTLLNDSIAKVNAVVDTTQNRMKSVTEMSKKSVEEGVKSSRECEQVFDQILGKSQELNDSVRDVAMSSSEQSEGIQQITTAVHQLDSTTQQNSQSVLETSRASDELKHLAHNVWGVVEELQFIIFGHAVSEDNSSEEEGLEDYGEGPSRVKKVS